MDGEVTDDGHSGHDQDEKESVDRAGYGLNRCMEDMKELFPQEHPPERTPHRLFLGVIFLQPRRKSSNQTETPTVRNMGTHRTFPELKRDRRALFLAS